MVSLDIADPVLRDELLAMQQEDLRVRTELAADGSLYDGYHPRMELVHQRNAARLLAILQRTGWPGRSTAGPDGAHAAWLVAQHAIGDPELQRAALRLLRGAVALGEAAVVEVAMLEDRIRVSEGRAQRYGTQFDWDEHGQMSPLPIEEAEHIDGRRRAIGLGPLSDETARRRRRVAETGERPPDDWHARQSEMDEWFRSRGWRK